MPCTITVRIKDDEKSLKKDYLIYEHIFVDQNDPIIKACVEELLKEFNAEPSDIYVNIKLEIV
jgi:hypothetical protein